MLRDAACGIDLLPAAVVVIVSLQLVVFVMYGLVNDYVLHRIEYQVCCAVVVLLVLALLWRVWHMDMLAHRAVMLRVAALFDMVALLLLGGWQRRRRVLRVFHSIFPAFAALKVNQCMDARATSSPVFVALVMGDSWLALVSAGLCGVGLLHVTWLWAAAQPPDAGDSINPIDVACVEHIQWWNAAVAGERCAQRLVVVGPTLLLLSVLGLLGPPVSVPCLASCLLAGATVHSRIPSASNKRDMFYPVKGTNTARVVGTADRCWTRGPRSFQHRLLRIHCSLLIPSLQASGRRVQRGEGVGLWLMGWVVVAHGG